MKLWSVMGGVAAAVVLLGCEPGRDVSPAERPCKDGSACSCEDGRKGTDVCDVDSQEFIMCMCQEERPRSPDSGADPEDASAEPLAGAGGHLAADAGPGPAAGSGGTGGQAATDAGASTHGKGADKSQGKANGKGNSGH
jgi:hypothetical protein